MTFKTPEPNAEKRRLDAALTIYDLRDIAKRRTPKAAFDYTEGAAEAEISLARARQAFEDIAFHQSIMRDVSYRVHGLGGSRRTRRPAVRHCSDGLHPDDAYRG